MRSFLKCERAQAAIEYILVVGAAVFAAISISAIYMKIVRSTGERIARNMEIYFNATNNELERWLRIFSA